jgi:hypothetical protein
VENGLANFPPIRLAAEYPRNVTICWAVSPWPDRCPFAYNQNASRTSRPSVTYDVLFIIKPQIHRLMPQSEAQSSVRAEWNCLRRNSYIITTTFERFEVFTVATAKMPVAPGGSCKNGRFGRLCHLHHQGGKNRRARKGASSAHALHLIVTAKVVPSSMILSTLITEAIISSEKLVLTSATCQWTTRCL